jgi:hypothetical protein
MPTYLEHHARTAQTAGLAAFLVRVIGWTALAAWRATRITLLALLVVLEPLVRTVLSGAAVLLIAMALFFEYGYGATPPSFRFVPMLLCGLGCAIALVGYYTLIRFLIQS